MAGNRACGSLGRGQAWRDLGLGPACWQGHGSQASEELADGWHWAPCLALSPTCLCPPPGSAEAACLCLLLVPHGAQQVFPTAVVGRWGRGPLLRCLGGRDWARAVLREPRVGMPVGSGVSVPPPSASPRGLLPLSSCPSLSLHRLPHSLPDRTLCVSGTEAVSWLQEPTAGCLGRPNLVCDSLLCGCYLSICLFTYIYIYKKH